MTLSDIRMGGPLLAQREALHKDDLKTKKGKSESVDY